MMRKDEGIRVPGRRVAVGRTAGVLIAALEMSPAFGRGERQHHVPPKAAAPGLPRFSRRGRPDPALDRSAPRSVVGRNRIPSRIT